MSRPHPLTFLGLALIATGFAGRGWMIPAVWFGANVLAVGIAHGRGAHRLFGKRPDGTLPLWSWIVFLPLHLFTMTLWHAVRWFHPGPAQSRVTDDLVIGRRLLPSEADGRFDNYLDLTAEFPEPCAIRRSPGYRCFPILDGGAPSAGALREAVDRLPPGRTFVHCAQGYGRSGLFALAVLLKSGLARTVEDGLARLRSVRPRVNLTRAQRRCIEGFYDRLLADREADGRRGAGGDTRAKGDQPSCPGG